TFMPTPIGVAIGAVVGLIAAFDRLDQVSEAVRSELKELEKADNDFFKTVTAGQKAIGLTDQTAGIFGKTSDDVMKANVQSTEKEIESLVGFLQSAAEKIGDLEKKLQEYQNAGDQ